MHTIAQIKTFPHKTKCTGLRGRIVKVGKWINGNHQEHGPWSFQDLEVQDDTGKMIVCLEKHDELPQSWRGVDVVFTGGERDGAPTGLIADDHTPRPTNYAPNPTPYRRLRVTQAGRLSQDDGQEPQQPNPQAQPQPRQQAPQQRQTAGQTYDTPSQAHDAANGRQSQAGPRQQPAQQQRPAAQQQRPAQQQPAQQRPQTQQRPKDEKPDALTTAKRLAARIAVCKQIAHGAAAANAWVLYETHGVKTTQEGVGAEASGIFIEMMRKMDLLTFEALPYVLPPPAHAPRRLADLYDMARAAEVARNQEQRTAPRTEAPPAQTAGPRQRVEPAQQSTPAPEPDADGAQWEQPADEQQGKVGDPGDSWQEGLEDDDIPF